MRPDARALERLLGRVLQIGATVSTVLLAGGLLLTLAAPGLSPAEMMSTLGLLILIGTPFARVLASVVGYAAERDWTFFALTLSVLLTLVGSLIVAALD